MTRARPTVVSWASRQTMIAHARSEAPKECCGLLVGRDRRVYLAVPLTNIDPRPRTGFQVDPAEHIAVRRVLRRLGTAGQIVGVYHSHPAGPAAPSPRDIAESHYPEWLYVIIGRSGRAIRAFDLRPAGPVAVPVQWERHKSVKRPR